MVTPGNDVSLLVRGSKEALAGIKDAPPAPASATGY